MVKIHEREVQFLLNSIIRWMGLLLIGILIGFSASMILLDNGKPAAMPSTGEQSVPGNVTSNPPADKTDAAEGTKEETGTVDADGAGKGQIFIDKGCIQCHAVGGLGVDGGQTAPDLSIAYEDTNNRFNKELKEFLDNPEGTMKAVLGAKPLTEEEKTAIVEILKELAEK